MKKKQTISRKNTEDYSWNMYCSSADSWNWTVCVYTYGGQYDSWA